MLVFIYLENRYLHTNFKYNNTFCQERYANSGYIS